MPDSPAHDLAWWQRGAIYQIYPRSFADGDGDGVGDLRGILSRLGHVAGLAAEAIWLSPFYAIGPAWTLDERTGQYYLHSFHRAQPDLNWDTPGVEAGMHDVLRFWL